MLYAGFDFRQKIYVVSGAKPGDPWGFTEHSNSRLDRVLDVSVGDWVCFLLAVIKE